MVRATAAFPRWTPEEYRQRPRDFDPGLAEQMCDRVANGETLSEMCADRDLPLPATFLRWVREDETLSRLWRQAQIDRLDVLSEECVLISDSCEDAPTARNRMQARQWMAERLNPKKYSQRATLNLGSGDDDDGAGVDYAGEVRRKLEEMAERRKATPALAPAG